MEKPVLLLVEDDPLVVMVAEEVLLAAGFKVIVANNGTEAENQLSVHSPKLTALVTDVRLGNGPDGWQIARHARELRADLRVVYLIADSAAEWRKKEVPNSQLVLKPYAPAQLVNAICTLINDASDDLSSAPKPLPPLPQ